MRGDAAAPLFNGYSGESFGCFEWRSRSSFCRLGPNTRPVQWSGSLLTASHLPTPHSPPSAPTPPGCPPDWLEAPCEGRKGALLLLRGILYKIKACAVGEKKRSSKNGSSVSSKVCDSTLTEDAAGQSAVRTVHMWAARSGVTTHWPLRGGEELLSHISAGGHGHTSSYHCPVSLKWYRNKPIIVKVLHGHNRRSWRTRLRLWRTDAWLEQRSDGGRQLMHF